MTTTPRQPHRKGRINSGPDWDAIFQRRPDLEPPGYRETLARCNQKHAAPER